MAGETICGLCAEGGATVWCGAHDGTTITWKRLKHVDRWEIVANRNEATKKRTSDTCGASVKFCGDIIDFVVNVTNTLCYDAVDWLYCDILDNERNPAIGACKYFFLSWDPIHAQLCHPRNTSTGTETPPETTLVADVDGFNTTGNGIYLLGQVAPAGFGVDNDGTDPATADWAIDVLKGPVFPQCSAIASVTQEISTSTGGFSSPATTS